MTRRGRIAIGGAAVLSLVITVACGGGSLDPSAGSPSAQAQTPPTKPTSSVVATPAPSASPEGETATAPTGTPSATVRLPAGFPLEPRTATDLVVGAVGARTFEIGSGGAVRDVSALRHPSTDGAYANAAGWNCRVHVEYEGAPAADWYVQPGTPVYATMDGTAILIMNTAVNAFDYYAVDREPYIGEPDRVRAPVSPFPGAGGGMGFYVAVIGDEYRTDYGHLGVAMTLEVVPEAAFEEPYSRGYDYGASFGIPRLPTEGTQIATWPVHRGDLVGHTGDTGYSEAPHLHYEITRLSDGAQLCPTRERGFADGGWLER